MIEKIPVRHMLSRYFYFFVSKFIEIDNHYQYNEVNKYLFEGDSDEL